MKLNAQYFKLFKDLDIHRIGDEQTHEDAKANRKAMACLQGILRAGFFCVFNIFEAGPALRLCMGVRRFGEARKPGDASAFVDVFWLGPVEFGCAARAH